MANFVPLNHLLIICLYIYIISQGSYRSWKVIVCVVCKLLQARSKDKIQASYVRKYLKTRMTLTIFKSSS